jgi:hypothetical protein
LLDLGATPLVAVEPDPHLATYLRETIPDKALSVMFSSFEEAALSAACFDLGVSATAFHWLNEGHGVDQGRGAATWVVPSQSSDRQVSRALRFAGEFRSLKTQDVAVALFVKWEISVARV